MPENFVISPVIGAFDLALVREWLDARIDAFEDPRYPRYILVGVPSEHALQRRATGPRARGAVIYLAVEQIGVVQDAYANIHALRSAMDFVVWLTERYKCRVVVDGYGSVTDELNRHGARSLYEDDVRCQPLLWEPKLLRLGFFWEVHDVDSATSHKLAHLESGRFYRAVEESTRDYFDDDIELGPRTCSRTGSTSGRSTSSTTCARITCTCRERS